jgi:30S ribosomal protein S31
MGKGDKRTRRGKIFAGSFGKVRPKPNNERKHTAPSEGSEVKETKKKPVKKKEPRSDG